MSAIKIAAETNRDQPENARWTRTDVIVLSQPFCTRCGGHGLIKTIRTDGPCKCVLRAVFRACYAKFRECVARQRHITGVRLDAVRGAQNVTSYGRKNEEYVADFCIIAKRTLTDPEDYRLFKFYFLLAADWKLCCRRFGYNRANFFYAIYRIEEKLGRAFRETEPYGIYPVDEYFSGTVRTKRVAAAIVLNRQDAGPVYPPVGEAA